MWCWFESDEIGYIEKYFFLCRSEEVIFLIMIENNILLIKDFIYMYMILMGNYNIVMFWILL